MLRSIVYSLLMLTPALAARAQDLPAQNLPLIGSSGGTYFERMCPKGSVLSGLRSRSGLVLDAVGIYCSAVRTDGTLSAPVAVGTLAGGSGGTPGGGACNGVIAGQQGVFQVGMGIAILAGVCYRWSPAARAFTGSGIDYKWLVSAGVFTAALRLDACTEGTQPAVGIRGRAGSIVDSFGLKCNEP